MMMKSMSLLDANDTDLVAASLAGNREAFGEIVSRYQSLICSVAYSATGSLTQSEDLAQETFVAAWKHLGTLNEPAKLRSWLCGIARNLVHNTLSRQGREPSHAAESLDALHESASPEPPPVAQAISKEEEAILWRSLEQIPETYREPLILFYREHQSVERVAQELELSEDAVKQRLSRGRKLLHEQVAAFVEGTLQRTSPGKAFTLAVLAALPVTMATSASAATLGTVAKGVAAAKGATLMGILGALVGPLAGIFGAWMGVRASLDSAESEREREYIRKGARQMTCLVMGFLLAGGGLALFGYYADSAHRPWLNFLTPALVISYIVALTESIVRFNREIRVIRTEEARRTGAKPMVNRAALWQTYEYISPWRYLGLPLVHIRTGRAEGEKLRPAIGWIAIGDLSIGILFSMGGIAFGGISLGGASVGLLGIGGVTLGALSLGGAAFGWWASGGMAVGWLAHGGFAAGWHAAMGGLAVAHEFAMGGTAHSLHANNEIAQAALANLPFFAAANALMKNPFWLATISWLPMMLVIWQGMRVRKALKKQRATTVCK